MTAFSPSIRFDMFLDRREVQQRVDAADRRGLMRAGAAVRLTARRSIRKRKSISQPGKPPHSHEGTLRRLIFFAFDRDAESVVIGPLARRTRTGSHGAALLEAGGTVVRSGRRGRRRLLRYRPRPFMGPALEKSRPRIPDFWRDSLT